MKIYLSISLGDWMCFDSILTQKERESFTEIYWTSRFARIVAPLLDRNMFYNIKKHYFIDEVSGSENFKRTKDYFPGKESFWHFRPDVEPDYTIGKELLGINPEDGIVPIDVAAMFNDPNRSYTGSTFLMNASLSDIDWDKLGLKPRQYILCQPPNSSRPQASITSMDNSDWEFIEKLSVEKGFKVVIITDKEITQLPLSNYIIIKNEELFKIVALCKYAFSYVGCDSFVSILCSKCIPANRLLIKTHDREIFHKLPTYTWIQRFYLPNKYEDIQTFYKPDLQ